MAITIDPFSSRSLTNVANNVKATTPFLLNTFFAEKEWHDTSVVDVESYGRNNKLAMFTKDGDSPVVVNKGKRTIDTVRLPMTNEQKIFTADEINKFKRINETYNNRPTEVSKVVQDNVLMEVSDLKERILGRREWLAAQIITSGAITVSQDNIAFTYDFGFTTAAPASGGHIYSLTSTKKWDKAAATDPEAVPTVNPLEDLREWSRVMTKRNGIAPDTVIMGSGAVELFLKGKHVRDELALNNLKVGSLNLRDEYKHYGNYIGQTTHGLKIFEYNQTYYDDDDAEQDMIGNYQVIMGYSKHKNNRIHYGPIIGFSDKSGSIKNFMSGEYFLESSLGPENTEIKTALKWTIKQRSLPATHNPDLWLAITVYS